MLTLDIFDVGHGACNVIHCPNGARIMLDCGFRANPGWFPSIVFRDRPLDLLVFENLDEDHLADLGYLCESVPVRSIFSNPTVSRDALSAMKARGGMGEGVRTAHAILNRYGAGLIGRPARLGSVRAWAYWNRYGMDFTDTNNLSLAVFVRYGAFTALFTGDLEKAGWQALLRRPGFILDLASVNLFVASHHGRSSGRCDEVFDICCPNVFVISDEGHRFDSQDTTDWYRRRASGIPDLRVHPDPVLGYPHRYVLTTRRDGTLRVVVAPSGQFMINPEYPPSGLAWLLSRFWTEAVRLPA